ncbi:MAG: glycosyltransferase family 4 protein [Patescibacteria group bacterium]
MKLLVFTQKIDLDDPGLSFFHEWVRELSLHFESVIVICLYRGRYNLPENVHVLSLGKETGASRFKYLKNFYSYIWKHRKEYDKVFVHMNQEYILLGGAFWKLWGKKIYMWRNHHAGSWLTDLASTFCTKVFCTSRFSYTAKYKKTEIMPVGVPLLQFAHQEKTERIPQSLLFLARIAPIKKPDLFIDALMNLRGRFPKLTGNIYGDPLPEDASYYEQLKRRVTDAHGDSYITFHKGVPNTETPTLYGSHEFFVNLSSSGMYDKTIFEAMASGCLVIASNENLRGQIHDDCIFKDKDLPELIMKLEKMLRYTSEEREARIREIRACAEKHSLKILGTRLVQSMT